ncbi:MAG: glycosyltransferase family 2 protein [Anaerolineales bacterium]
MSQLAAQPSVIIPTLNAAGHLPELLRALEAQSLQPLEIILIDSSSEDSTRDIARQAGCRLEVIPREAFDHGGTRNQAARIARGEILVFLTQDALPADGEFLQQLLEPLITGAATASTARQIASETASPLEVFSRQSSYPGHSRLGSLTADTESGSTAITFSNAASAVKRTVFEQLGGFPEGLVVNEDMLFYTRLLRAGYTVAYRASAVVIHSHNFSLREQFQRYFDIGCFMSQAEEELGDLQLGNRGLQFALGQIAYLIRQRRWFWIPRSLFESCTKLLAYALGHFAYLLPASIAMHLSRQKSHWRT